MPETAVTSQSASESKGESHHTISFESCLAYLEKQGRSLYGPTFQIQESDHPLLFKLMVYFLRDLTNLERTGLDLRKGILLSGPVGCGKTSLMILMRAFLPIERRHLMKPCREVSFEFIQEGYQVIHRYSSQSILCHNSQLVYKTYCFDDLGVENNLKFYGNECNVMAEILLSRYDLFISHGLLTHATTNLNAKELETAYGSRVRSRMREMFNLIGFDKEVGDKRR
jgi:hypothetical protein